MTTTTVHETEAFNLTMDSLNNLYNLECLKTNVLSAWGTCDDFSIVLDTLNAELHEYSIEGFNEACADMLAPELQEHESHAEYLEELAHIAKTQGRRQANYYANN